jgi:hypothetical protein
VRARAELERLLVEESGIASFDKLTALVDDVIANRSMEFVSLSQQMNDLCKQRVL